MHLGRFHAVIYDLVNHFESKQIIQKFDSTITSLEQFISSRESGHLGAFRTEYESLLSSVEISDPDLYQPYAKQVIEEINIDELLGEQLKKNIASIIDAAPYDHVAIATGLKKIRENIKTTVGSIVAIETSFSSLEVEFERVEDDECEIGFMISQDITGQNLATLIKEFKSIERLAHAFNELTDSQQYSPKVRTISSSWWQVFLEIDVVQVAAWTVAIERIVALYKSNLEIKMLKKQLEANNISKEITALLEQEINRKVEISIAELAKELRQQHKEDSDQRANEIETQLKQGLIYLANRLSQGAQVEINVSKLEAADAESTESPKEREKLEKFDAARKGAYIASSKTAALEDRSSDTQLLPNPTDDELAE